MKYTSQKGKNKCIGEHNSADKLHGRGIKIRSYGSQIGYWEDGFPAPGKYIDMLSGGDYIVGEYYRDLNSELKNKKTCYSKDGTIQQ